MSIWSTCFMAKLSDRCFCYFPAAILVFLMQEGRQDGVSIQLQSSINMGNTVNENICQTKSLSDMNLGKNVCIFISFYLLWIECSDSIFWRRVCERLIFLLPFTQVSKVAKEQIKQAEKTQLQVSMEKTPLLQDTSEDTVSTSCYLDNEVRNYSDS